jgi:hypothetical protein
MRDCSQDSLSKVELYFDFGLSLLFLATITLHEFQNRNDSPIPLEVSIC